MTASEEKLIPSSQNLQPKYQTMTTTTTTTKSIKNHSSENSNINPPTITTTPSPPPLRQKQMTITFVSVPMLGHMAPFLPYIEELLHHTNHSVTIIHPSDLKYRQMIDSRGLSACTSLTYDLKNDDSNKGVRGGGFTTWNRAIFETMMDYYDKNNNHPKPNVILFDFFAVGAADAADALSIPAIGIYPNPLSLNPWPTSSPIDRQRLSWHFTRLALFVGEGILSRLLWCYRNKERKFGYSRRLPLLMEQDLYPCPTMPRLIMGCTSSKHFELDGERVTERCGGRYQMVGPAVTTRQEMVDEELAAWVNSQTKPIVYVSFGTMFSYNESDVKMLECQLRERDLAILWSLPLCHQQMLLSVNAGDKNDEQQQQQQQQQSALLPSHWKVVSFLPQVSLFRTGQITAFITHCGSNSVYEALLEGIPMICRPIMADQPANATRVSHAGVGFIVKGKRMEAVGEALDELMGRIDEFRERSRLLAEVLRKEDEGGAKRAVRLIEEVGRRGTWSGVVEKRWRTRIWFLPLFILGVVVFLVLLLL